MYFDRVNHDCRDTTIELYFFTGYNYISITCILYYIPISSLEIVHNIMFDLPNLIYIPILYI